MKTYSRLKRSRADDEEPNTKRRRILQHSSPASKVNVGRNHHNDPSSDAICDADGTSLSSSPRGEAGNASNQPCTSSSTPPSSPPPTVTTSPSKSQIIGARDVSSQPCYDAQATSETVPRPALADLNANRLNAPPTRPRKPVKYTQMHLDFGQKVRQRCKVCGMEYAPSVAEDATVHKQFHNMNVGGVGVGRAFIESRACQSRSVWHGSDEDRIIECCTSDERILKNKARAVLDVVDTELGAIKIEDDHLWAAKEAGAESALFKAYLYVRGSRCIGLCLVENLKLANKVLAEEEAEAAIGDTVLAIHRRTLKTAEQPEAVLRGITRIWTSQSHRREGLAMRLLDCAQRHAVYGRVLAKRCFAFSQPTDDGTALARKWFGLHAGWHVYAG